MKDKSSRIVVASVILIIACGTSVLAIRARSSSASARAELRADVSRKREAAYLESLKQKRKNAAVLLEIQQRTLKAAESDLESTSKAYSDARIHPADQRHRVDAVLDHSKREAVRIRNDIKNTEQKINEISDEIMRLEKERSQDMI